MYGVIPGMRHGTSAGLRLWANGMLTKSAAPTTYAPPTVDNVRKVAIDEVCISPAKKLRDGPATKPHFGIVGEHENDGFGEFVDEKISPTLSLGEFERGGRYLR